MHNVALQLAPVIAAEKSKAPFYIVGGVLVLWALVLGVGVGMRATNFPANLGQQRAVIAVTAVLVIATVATAVLTSGSPAKTGEKRSVAAVSPAAGETRSSTSATGSQPTASTGTPAPASSPASGAASSLALAANPAGQLSYDTKQLSAKAGTVSITMANMSPLEHNVTVAEGTKVLGATPTFAGGSKTLVLKLKPGRYTFFCSVPGHRQGGMEGTLTVS